MSIDPDPVAYMYHKGSWGQYYATHFLDDPELFSLIDRARTLPAWSDRQPLYEEIQRRIVADQPEIFGMIRDRNTATRDYVQGLVDSPIRMASEFDLYPLYIGRQGPSRPMLRFIVKRSAFMLLMVAGLLAITFTISHVAPGDPAWLAAGPNATEAMVQTLRAEYGMDKPVVAQFGGYLAGVVQGDLGRSITTTRPVFQDLLRYFPATLELVLRHPAFHRRRRGAGTLAAATQNRWPDHLIRLLSTSGVAFPMFSLGLLLKYAFAQHLEWLPLGGRLDMLAFPPDTITGFTPSTACCTATSTPSCRRCPTCCCRRWRCRFRRWPPSSASTAPRCWKCCARTYIVAARAHGVAPWRVIAKYALRNAMLPTLAMIGLRFGWMLGGTVLIESVFDWPGIGLYAVQATMNSDFQPIMGVTLVLGVSFMLINFVIDIIYGLLDPRVRQQG